MPVPIPNIHRQGLLVWTENGGAMRRRDMPIDSMISMCAVPNWLIEAFKTCSGEP